MQRLKGRKVSLTLTHRVLGGEIHSSFNNNNNNNNNNLSSFLRMLGPTFRLTLSCHVGSPSPNTRWPFRHSSNRSQNKNITPALCYNVYLHKLLPSLLACARSDYKQLWEHDCGPTTTIMLRNHKVLPPKLFFSKRKRRNSLINVLKG